MSKREIKHVCLITTNHISTNPRLVKEAIALEEAGLEVAIIFSQHNKGHSLEDFRILQQHPNWKYKFVNWKGDLFTSKLRRVFTGIIKKLAGVLGKKVRSGVFYRLILNRNYFSQLQLAKSVRADLYIAHNAGALAVAAEAATSSEYAFDAEDFHRGEALDPITIKAVKEVEDLYLPNARYVTAASPLIAQEYEALYPQVHVTTIRNVFPSRNNDLLPSSTNDPLQLFWFSQTVGMDRGIQDIIRALRLVENRGMQLHIYGSVSETVGEELKILIDSLAFPSSAPVIFHEPVSPDTLLELASSFDIGFATEPGFCQNNKIALSNKIFTYMVGGNAIIFSDTPAQELFYSEHPEVGFLYKSGDSKILSEYLIQYDDDRSLLLKHKVNSKLLFMNVYNWEKEKEKFLGNIVTKVSTGKEQLLTTTHGI